eukprot:1156037-Pelagomonas_calceolata.AAC.1
MHGGLPELKLLGPTQILRVSGLTDWLHSACGAVLALCILTERLLLVWASWTLFRASWASTSPRCGHAAPAFK